MWSAGSEPAQVYLGLDSVGLWIPGTSALETQWHAVSSARDGWTHALSLLSDRQLESRRHRVAVWLSGALARPFLFEPVQGLRRASEALEIARGLAADQTGLDGPCDVWMDHWSPQTTCLAVAVGKTLRDDIERAAKANGVILTSLKPWWSYALNDAVGLSPTDLRLVAVDEPDAITLIGGTREQFGSVASFVPKPEASQIEALMTRTLLAADADASQSIRAMLPLGEFAESPDLSAVPAQPFAPCWERPA